LGIVVPANTARASLRVRLESHLASLPVLPMAVSQLMGLDPDASGYFDGVLAVLETEPNFAARILVAANSATSAPSEPIITLGAAITRIGSRAASNLVLASNVAPVFVPHDDWEWSLWRHGVQVAHTARALARFTPDPAIDPDEAYTTALLHDIGRFVLFKESPDELRAIDAADWDSPAALLREERKIVGLTHAEIGSMACATMRLPRLIELVVRHHHDRLPFTYTTKHQKLAALVRLADYLMFPSAMPGSPGRDETLDEGAFRELAPWIPSFITISYDQLHELIVDATRTATAACTTAGMP
jgi:putative nucleotidyltransferase with HDIG domain